MSNRSRCRSCHGTKISRNKGDLLVSCVPCNATGWIEPEPEPESEIKIQTREVRVEGLVEEAKKVAETITKTGRRIRHVQK